MIAFERSIAERGLTVDHFDGVTIFLNYEPANDAILNGRLTFEAVDLRVFAVAALNGLTPGPPLFPGLKGVKILSARVSN
jgi:hypothetical protein